MSAQFPNTIATDATLKVAGNNIRTALRGGISAGSTAIAVVDDIGIVPNMLLSIDREIMSVVSVTDDTVLVTRGFDGTVAMAHSNGRPVEGRIDAWHHNSLVDEVEAIETALGPNLSNIAANLGGSVLNTRYDFTPQAPGGSLGIGANVITLTPVPAGVSVSNTTYAPYYLYLSGGTGTAEAVPIIGGTAVAGAASGTVIVTCANTHSGAWTISSATAGGMEAKFSLPTDPTYGAPYKVGTVVFPDGVHTLHAGMNISPVDLVSIRGQSRSVKLNFDANMPNAAFTFTCGASDQHVDRNRIGLFEMTIRVPSTTQDGVVFDNYSNAAELMRNVNVHGGRRGLWSKATSTAAFTNLRFSGFTTHGIYADVTGGQGESTFTNILITTPAAANTAIGFYALATSAVSLAGSVYIYGMRIFGTYVNGVKVESTAGLQSVYFFANQLVVDGEATDASLFMKSVQNAQFGECWFSNGYSNGANTNNSYAAIVDGTNLISFSNTVFGMSVGVGGDVLLRNAANLTQLLGCKFGGTINHLRFDLVSMSTKLVLRGNVQVDTAVALVKAIELPALAFALQYATLDSPPKYQFHDSYTDDLILQNITPGATNPAKYMRVDGSGTLQFMNNTHTAFILQVTEAGRVIVGSVQDLADNAAALAAGLPIGAAYRTGDIAKWVH